MVPRRRQLVGGSGGRFVNTGECLRNRSVAHGFVALVAMPHLLRSDRQPAVEHEASTVGSPLGRHAGVLVQVRTGLLF